jgi:hypothetical protein
MATIAPDIILFLVIFGNPPAGTFTRGDEWLAREKCASSGCDDKMNYTAPKNGETTHALSEGKSDLRSVL